MARPTKAEINLLALRNNYRLAARIAPQSKTIAVIKANGYGHGAVEVAKTLEQEVPAFAVACIEEAIELREAGIQAAILLLEGCFSADELLLAVRYHCWVTVENRRQVNELINAELKSPLEVWLKIDTGMHRLGLSPSDVAINFQQLAQSSNVHSNIVLMTHISCGDELDSDVTARQLESYEKIFNECSALAEGQSTTVEKSIANSAGVLAWPNTRHEWNRPGYMLFGGKPFLAAQHYADQLKPVMTLKTAVMSLRNVAEGECVGYGANWCASRPSIIATLPIGYADGYPRVIQDGTPVLIKGKRAPIVGNVSMDMITIDVTDIEDIELGDEVIMWGEGLSIDEVALCANTIGYELMARMPMRVPRVYAR